MFIQPKILAISAGLTIHCPAQSVIPGWDESRLESDRVQNLSFDLSPGNLAISDFGIHAILLSSSTSVAGLEIYPAFDFRSTILTFNDVPTSLPVDVNQLKTFSAYPTLVELSNLAMLSSGDSRWIFGMWTRAQLATDFKNLGYDDFSFDIACGFGYQFTDRLSMGVGAAAMDINSQFPTFLPGVALDWMINDRFRIQGCGPVWRATYSPDPIWQFSIRSDSTGEIWNIADDTGKSRFIDLTSYRVGAFFSLLLADDIRFELGTGITFGNEISLRQPDGRTIIKQGLDNGWFGQVGLTMQCW